MKSKAKLPKAGHHAAPKPRLRARHLSSAGKSAYSGPGAALPAFPSAPGGAAFPGAGGGAPSPMPDPGAGGPDSAALAGPGGAPGM